MPELAAEAGLLEAAERRRDADRAVRVDAEHAGLERARDAQGAGAVRGPDRAGQAVRRVVRDPDRVRLVVERDQRGDRAEDLFAGDPVVVRRLDERARVPVALARGRLAAEERLAVDEAGDGLAVLRGDQRAHLGRVVAGVADLDVAGRGDEQLGEAVVGAALDEDARAGAAVLAGVVEDGVGRGGGGLLEVGVGEDDVRGLPAELERDALDRRRRRPRMTPRVRPRSSR